MFEAAEQGREIAQDQYDRLVPKLRKQLLESQFALAQSGFPVIIIVEGIDNVSKGEVINILNEWLDTRGLHVCAFGPKSDEETERPRFWRYWRALPANGRMAIMAGAWYSGSLIQGTFNKVAPAQFDLHMKRIHQLETMLTLDGALILKYWLHLSKPALVQRFKSIEASGGQRWQVSGQDRQLLDEYDSYLRAAERAIQLTDHVITPWHIVESENTHYRNLTVARHILRSIRKRLKNKAIAPLKSLAQPSINHLSSGCEQQASLLSTVDLDASVSKSDYTQALAQLQSQLNRLAWQAYHRKRSVVILFEGWDAAGKGGAIRRITQAIDARIAQVISVAAPSDEERAHHYLWRFWRHLPRAGHVTIYDRSWYGRVLVERVEAFAQDFEWQRAYREINEFEEQLCDHGTLVIKFWLHIDPREQLKRFKEREKVAYKRHKITDEDWRNRDKWPSYETAVNDMIIKTSTEVAPWHLIAANNKRHARLCVLRTLCAQLEQALNTPTGQKEPPSK